MRKILFLSAWYPHRYDAMAGLFVRKHAQAVGLFAETCVLFLYADENIKEFEITEQHSENVQEIYIYFPFCKNRLLNRISKAINYLIAFYKGFGRVKKSFGKPDFTLANVLTRNGFLALILKKTQKIPYAVIEHWSRYLPENFSYSGFFHKKITEKVVKNANALFTVSELLKKAMQKAGLTHPDFYVIDNVVDNFFFERTSKQYRNRKRMILVSCFAEKSKNVCGILNAVRKITSQRSDFEFIIVGSGADFELVKSHYRTLNFPENRVFFLGELPPEETAKQMKQSDFAVHFSNFETYGVVIAESLAAGLPLISTPTGIAPDVIDEHNGLLVDFKDEAALAEKIDFMLDNFQNYNSPKISKTTKERFIFEKIGRDIIEKITTEK